MIFRNLPITWKHPVPCGVPCLPAARGYSAILWQSDQSSPRLRTILDRAILYLGTKTIDAPTWSQSATASYWRFWRFGYHHADPLMKTWASQQDISDLEQIHGSLVYWTRKANKFWAPWLQETNTSARGLKSITDAMHSISLQGCGWLRWWLALACRLSCPHRV